ncbi:hypothetical protein [Campylobacter concisus]|uniref:hypothetical protein n=1 Tax=Campylobacter concisus TaxID=199 RepID=UPI0015E17251|nr:hypothetical protein [Campylobacter concisus]
MTNFCWHGRYKFEAWLNFTRVASRPHFLGHLIEILLKELYVGNGGAARFVQ